MLFNKDKYRDKHNVKAEGFFFRNTFFIVDCTYSVTVHMFNQLEEDILKR